MPGKIRLHEPLQAEALNEQGQPTQAAAYVNQVRRRVGKSTLGLLSDCTLRMTNPWTIGGNRVELSSPSESWERGTELDLQEGPEQLRLQSPTADPMIPTDWTKSGPVFTGIAGVYGVGHASFTTSPDNTESWIVYHSEVAEAPGWDRVVRMQQFTWLPSCAPVFGDPTASGVKVTRSAGECP